MDSYFSHQRPEMLRFVPAGARRVLDVGCGNGGFGAALRKNRPGIEVWGVEPDVDAAANAAKVLDRAIQGMFTSDLDLPGSGFDAVIFNDSLEHFPDHVPALRLAASLIKPGGSLVASIPNVRHWPHMKHYIFQADWAYSESGILDRTHLRFFTRKSILRTLNEQGFNVDHIEGITPCWRDIRLPLANALLPKSWRDIIHLQFALTAKLKRDGA